MITHLRLEFDKESEAEKWFITLGSALRRIMPCEEHVVLIEECDVTIDVSSPEGYLNDVLKILDIYSSRMSYKKLPSYII